MIYNKKMEHHKILRTIDLSRFAKKEKKERLRSPEEILNAIDLGMDHSIPLINERASRFENSPSTIVTTEGKINMNAYESFYGSEVIEFDIKNAFDQKRGFYQTYTKETQQRYGTDNERDIVAKISKEERMRDGNISEEVLFLLMNKIAGDRYMAVRSCDHDDFLNGTDLLLIDTITGETICAFDETVEGMNSRLDVKIQRAKDKLIKGRGMQVKYGMTFIRNQEGVTQMNLGSVKNIPPLFLALNKKSLEKLLQNMDFKIDTELSQSEQQAMSEIISSIDSQIGDLETVSQKTVSFESARDFMQHLTSNLSFVSENKKTA
jgi:hypothetical protein